MLWVVTLVAARAILLICSKSTDVRALCTVKYLVSCHKLWREKSFKSPITKVKHRNAEFELFILLGNAGLDFSVMYQDEIVGHVEAEYAEKFA